VNCVYPDHNEYISSLFDNDLLKKEEIKKQMVDFYPSVWNKIYKKELFNNGVKFKKNVWFEDVEFLYKLFPYIGSIGVIKKTLINYIQRDGSITKTIDKRLYNYIDNWNGIIEFYKEKNFYNEYFSEIEYCYCRYLLATFIKNATGFEKKDFDYAVKIAIKNVKEKFPNYKKNKYLNKTKKGLYIKYFNTFFANILYLIKNR
jgi:hypothetical protein